MKVNYVNLAIIILLILIVIFLLFGCIQFKFTMEHFSATEEDALDDLTEKEKELFEDLKENKLSTEEITDLVKGGVLTEKLVEKFLSQLSIAVEDDPTPVASSSKKKKKEEDEDEQIEGFMSGASQYAKVL